VVTNRTVEPGCKGSILFFSFSTGSGHRRPTTSISKSQLSTIYFSRTEELDCISAEEKPIPDIT
jgi:hypothetical protein